MNLFLEPVAEYKIGWPSISICLGLKEVFPSTQPNSTGQAGRLATPTQGGMISLYCISRGEKTVCGWFSRADHHLPTPYGENDMKRKTLPVVKLIAITSSPGERVWVQLDLRLKNKKKKPTYVSSPEVFTGLWAEASLSGVRKAQRRLCQTVNS
jgi:hypothetical protein